MSGAVCVSTTEICFFFLHMVWFHHHKKQHMAPRIKVILSPQLSCLLNGSYCRVWHQRQLGCRDVGGSPFKSGPLPAQIKVFVKVAESPSLTIMIKEIMLFFISNEICSFDWEGRTEIWVSTHVLGLIKLRRMKEYLQIIQIVGATVNPARGAFKKAIPWALHRNVASPIRARSCCKVEHARRAEAWNQCWCGDMLSFTFAPLPKGEINEVWRNQTHQKHWRIGWLSLKSFYQTIRPIKSNAQPEVF